MLRSHSKIKTNIYSPLKTLPSDYGPNAVQNATAYLFNQIYEAAKKKDGKKLTQIRDEYLLHDKEACYSIVWNGYTPLTLLLKEENLEAAGFLYARHFYPIMKTEVFLVTDKEMRDKIYKEPTKRHKPETIQEYIHCIEILAPHLNHIDELMKRVKIDRHFLAACSSALSGDHEAVSKFFSSNWLTTNPNRGVLKACIAYIYGKYHPNVELKEIWPGDCDTRPWLLKGFFAGGHFNQNVKFIDKKTHLPNELVVATLGQMLANPQYMLSPIYHPTILQSLLACIDRDDLREEMANFIKLFKKEFTGEEQEQNTINQILNKAFMLNRCMRIYHLNYEQALLFTQPNIFTWLMQGTQLITQGRLPDNESVIKIASLISGSSVPDETLKKLQFVTHLHFLIDDLDHYLSGAYKKNRHHVKRVRSFEEACLKADSLSDVKKLIHHQLGLFYHKAQGDQKSKIKHEKPFGKKGRDEFIDILEKHQARM